MTRCEDIEKDGQYKTFGEVLQKLIAVVHMYNDCATRHDGLVDYEERKNK